MSHFAGLKRATTCRACAIDIYAFRESRNSTLKPQDVIVALKLSLSQSWAGYAILGQELGMSMSEVHAAIRRLVESQLYDGESNHVRRRRLFEFIIHGLPVVYPARPKDVTRGVPTAWAAPVLANTQRHYTTAKNNYQKPFSNVSPSIYKQHRVLTVSYYSDLPISLEIQMRATKIVVGAPSELNIT